MSHINSSGSGGGGGSTGLLTLNYTGITFANSPYTVQSTDTFIGVNGTGGAVTVVLPNAPTIGRVYVVKDISGTAFSNHITVTTAGGTVLIDLTTTFVMNTPLQAAQFLFNGTKYLIF